MKLTFPKNFWWGAATSGPQSEGRFNKPHANVFDYWYEIKPEDFYNYVGPDTASDFYHSFREDIKLMKAIGLNTVRTSIQWTRLIDDFETASINPDGQRFYNAVIDEFIANGITPIINLHHFDLPVELYDKYGGWESKHVTDLYAKYAAQCFKLFGDRVKNWFTFNEPMVIVDGEYLYQFHYPKIVDGKKAVQVAYNLSLASAKAIKIYRQSPNNDGKIGIILNLTTAYPASQDSEDLAAANFADLWSNRLFLDPAIKGSFPQELVDVLKSDGVCFNSTPEELTLIKENTIDQLGVNYYHPFRVKRPEISPHSLMDWMPTKHFDNYDMPGRVMNVDKGWEIYPKALYDIALRIRNDYHNIPWFVSENGMGVSNEERFADPQTGQIQDDYRIKFMTQHLQWLHQGIEEGSNCFGYHVWTPIDCWSWGNAYRNRYGLISTNIHNQIKTVKASGEWFKQLSENNCLELTD